MLSFPFIGAILYTIFQGVTFAFVVISTPLQQFVPNNDTCLTYWGIKPCNASIHYVMRTKDYPCKRLRGNMNASAAFAIMSIVFTFIALLFGFMMLLRKACPIVVPLVFSSISLLTILITWACTADLRQNRHCNYTGEFYYYRYFTTGYNAGFILMVLAWILQWISLGVLIVLTCL